jgi:hypothetical protein
MTRIGMETTSFGRVSPPGGIGEWLVFRCEKRKSRLGRCRISSSAKWAHRAKTGLGTRGWFQSAEKKQLARQSNKTNNSPHIF